MYSVINTTDEEQKVEYSTGRTTLEPGDREDFDRVTNAEDLVSRGLIVRTRGGYLQENGLVTDSANGNTTNDTGTDREDLEEMEYGDLQSLASLNDVPAVGVSKDEIINELLDKDDIQFEEE